MPRFLVMIHGSRFNIPIEGSEPAIGFYTTRKIAAENEQEAKETAIDELLEEEQVKHFVAITRSISAREPLIEIESVRRLSWREHLVSKPAGFSFYANDDV